MRNQTKYIFHIGDDTVSTSYQNKPNKEHFVLSALFNGHDKLIIDYDELPDFDKAKDITKELRSFQDALITFTRKHPKLTKIFIVHKDRLEINKEYLEQTH